MAHKALTGRLYPHICPPSSRRRCSNNLRSTPGLNAGLFSICNRIGWLWSVQHGIHPSSNTERRVPNRSRNKATFSAGDCGTEGSAAVDPGGNTICPQVPNHAISCSNFAACERRSATSFAIHPTATWKEARPWKPIIFKIAFFTDETRQFPSASAATPVSDLGSPHPQEDSRAELP